ncbi:MAG: C39 family peptidase [Magnetospirillum sp.]|nr:C39 family peptidase [Magnetospirillum sp.]
MRNRIRTRALGLAAGIAAGLLGALPAPAGEMTIITTGGLVNVPVISLRESHFRTVVKQEHDFSCGSAALATLLSYHYDHPIKEDAVFQAMFKVGDQAAIRKSGFSLADMQRYLASIGYHSDGYKVPLAKVADVGMPAITLINTQGYNHFVVIKGIKDGDVLLGDPAAGLRVMPHQDFERMWQGIIFVIRDDADVGRRHFNLPDEWMVRREAPSAMAIDRHGLATFSTMFPGLFQFPAY